MRFGSEDHKELFCRSFIETHKPFRPEELPWPDLSQSTVDKLASFQIWDYAAHTERQVFNKLTAYANEEQDASLKEALRLQAYEEGRHADTLKYFLKRYNIPLNEIPDRPLPSNLERCFMSTGAGECIILFLLLDF